MSASLSAGGASAAANATARLLDNGYLRIYDGLKPANADTTIPVPNTLLAELRFGSISAPAALAGVLTFNPIAPDAAADAAGTPVWFRALGSDGTTVVMDGTVGTTAGLFDLVVDASPVASGGRVTCSSFVVGFAPGPVPSPDYAAILDLMPGLSHHWPLEDVGTTTAAARVGGVAGTYTGTISTDYTQGLRGGLVDNNGTAVHFNGAAGKVTFGDILDATGTTPFWVSAMIRLDADAVDTQMAIVDKQMNVGGTTREGWNLHVTAGRRIILQRWQANAADSCWPATVLTRREWYHVVATYDGTNLKVYIDGALAATQASPLVVQSSAANLSVGYSDGLSFYPFQGAIHAVGGGSGAVPDAAAVASLYDAASLRVGTTYYVSTSGDDANVGSVGSPWRTLYHLGGQLRAGDTAIVEPGTYTEVEAGQSVSRVRSPEVLVHTGTKRSPIVIRARNPWTDAAPTTVVWTGLQDTWHGFVMLSTSYVTWRDFHVTQNAIGTSFADVFCRAWYRGIPAGAIGPNASADWDAYDAADYCSFIGLRITNGFEPFKVSHAHGTLIQGCTFEGANVGMGAVNGSSITVDGCVFLFNRATAGSQESGVQFKGGTRGAVLKNCRFYLPTGADPVNTAIYVGGGSTDTGGLYDVSLAGFEGYRPACFNNVVRCDVPGAIMFGIVVQGVDDPYVCNNVVINCAAGFRIQSGGPMLGGTPGQNNGTTRPKVDNPIIRNNIVAIEDAVSNTGTYDILYETNAATDLSGTLVWSNNVLYRVANHQIAQSPSTPPTTNPNFVDFDADWHVQAGSSAIDAAATLTHTDVYGVAVAVGVDAAGVTRSGAWECGIYDGSV